MATANDNSNIRLRTPPPPPALLHQTPNAAHLRPIPRPDVENTQGRMALQLPDVPLQLPNAPRLRTIPLPPIDIPPATAAAAVPVHDPNVPGEGSGGRQFPRWTTSKAEPQLATLTLLQVDPSPRGQAPNAPLIVLVPLPNVATMTSAGYKAESEMAADLGAEKD
ncbi:hypothetical protein CALCODRAFT_509681 [Calocera cornea HHB12733]|uniref:Uncharacterized protein n=1 Tax=Calocera cornea HHB12733 TaxID=1353952 RepID=A0A165F3I6_9BASI|nr:hypothetical protein CALCODRAFT_509681 [Calocera cornea HHB12733]